MSGKRELRRSYTSAAPPYMPTPASASSRIKVTRETSLERTQPKKVVWKASQVEPVVGTKFQKTFETMELRNVIEITGILKRVYNNTDLYVLLYETQHQPQNGFDIHDSDTEQLLTAGIDGAILSDMNDIPSNITLPIKWTADGWQVRFKCKDLKLMEPLKDPEEKFGYKVDAWVRIQARTYTWHGWRGNDAGVKFYVTHIDTDNKPRPL